MSYCDPHRERVGMLVNATIEVAGIAMCQACFHVADISDAISHAERRHSLTLAYHPRYHATHRKERAAYHRRWHAAHRKELLKVAARQVVERTV